MLDVFKRKKLSSAEVPELEPMLACTISAGKVKAAIWTLDDHTIDIQGIGEKVFSPEGREEDIDTKELANCAADAIDHACSVAEVDVSKTMFGLPQSWIDGVDIKKPYEHTLEKLTKALDLQGLAYVSIPHAIAYLLQYFHRMPPTTILVGCTREGASLSLVHAGKIQQTHKIQWVHAHLGKNIQEGLALFEDVEEFPSTMHLYGFGDLQSAKAELDKFSWQSESPNTPNFIKTCQVFILGQHVDVDAVSLVAAKDFARQHHIKGKLTLNSPNMAEYDDLLVATAPSVTPATSSATPASSTTLDSSSVANNTTTSIEQQTQDALPSDPQSVDSGQSQLDASILSEIGFVKNADVMDSPDSPDLDSLESQPESDTSLTSPPTSTISGNSISPRQTHQNDSISDSDSSDQDSYSDTYRATPSSFVDQSAPEEQSQETESDLDELDEADDTQDEEDQVYSPPPKKSKKTGRRGKFFKQLLIVLLILLITLGLLGAALVYAYVNFPKATVEITVVPDAISKKIQILATEDSSISVQDQEVPLQKVSKDLEQLATTAATGTKTIGEQATGKVTIYNKSTQEQQLESGTTLTTASGLEFTLLEDISVASASVDVEGQTNGKAEADAQAKEIGSASNIPSDTSMQIDDFDKSDLEALAKGDFSGGTEEVVQIIARNDINKLKSELQADLEAELQSELDGIVAQGEIFFEDAYQQSEPEISYTKSVGDEGSDVSGTIKATLTAYVIRDADVGEIIQEAAKESVPEGYTLQISNLSDDVEFISYNGEELRFYAPVTATVVPQIDTDAIRRSIVGKKESAARQTILADQRIDDVRFDYSLNLPAPLDNLPQLEQNITINQTVKDSQGE
jgi:flagellar basal body-associated protein FliL